MGKSGQVIKVQIFPAFKCWLQMQSRLFSGICKNATHKIRFMLCILCWIVGISVFFAYLFKSCELPSSFHWHFVGKIPYFIGILLWHFFPASTIVVFGRNEATCIVSIALGLNFGEHSNPILPPCGWSPFSLQSHTGNERVCDPPAGLKFHLRVFSHSYRTSTGIDANCDHTRCSLCARFPILPFLWVSPLLLLVVQSKKMIFVPSFHCTISWHRFESCR